MRERQRQTATKPRYYIRGIEITAQTGLGRFGGAGGPRQRLRAPSSCRPPGPRSCQMARYPRTTPAISTASLPVLARRFRADPHEVGRIEGIGLAFLGSWSRRRPGPAHRGQRRTRPPAAGPRSRPDTSTRAGLPCRPGRPSRDPPSSCISPDSEPADNRHTSRGCGSNCGIAVSSWARTPTGFESPALHQPIANSDFFDDSQNRSAALAVRRPPPQEPLVDRRRPAAVGC